MKKIYLDYAASTPLDPRVLRAMKPYFTDAFGNPGSLHSFGQEAIAAIDHAREKVASIIGAEFRDIVFTGGATEANNLALRSAVAFARAKGIAMPRMIISAIEHESIRETAEDLRKEGVDVVVLPIDRFGVIDFDALKNALHASVALVSIMYANNEIGTVQTIAKIAEAVHEFRNSHGAGEKRFPLFHTDAVQAFQYLSCNIHELGVDMMTLSGHKIYGPKGVGMLYAKGAGTSESPLRAEVTGGGQEFGIRSGTENVPLIVGFAKALEFAEKHREKEAVRVNRLRDELWRGIKAIDHTAERNPANGWFPALPNILNIYFPGHEAQDLVMKFDLKGIAISSGSACRSRAVEPSYVIEALGFSKERANASVRISLGKGTSSRDIAGFLRVAKHIL